jgi:hypothetical protein
MVGNEPELALRRIGLIRPFSANCGHTSVRCNELFFPTTGSFYNPSDNSDVN